MNKVILLVISFLAVTAKSDTISLRADIWCPFNCKPGSAKEGFLIEMAKEIFTKAGHKIDYQELNWSRTLAYVAEGKVDGAAGASADDAKDLILPKNPFGVSQNCFYGNESLDWAYENINSLDKVVLAIAQDYAYAEEFDPYVKKYSKDKKRISVTSGDSILIDNIKKVSSGQVDTFIEDKNVVSYYLTNNKMKLKKAGCLSKVSEIFIAFSPKNPKSAGYAAILDAGLIEMKKSGKYKKILAKYGLTF